MSISNYAELEILDHLTGTASWSAPAAVYIKLHTGDPGEDCTGNAATEDTRKAVTFSAASSGAITSSATAEWTNVSTTETYSHWSLWDAATGGNPLWYGALSSSAAVTAGDTFQVTQLQLTLE
jgi:hypothetical protein